MYDREGWECRLSLGIGSLFELKRRSLISASRGEEHIASSEDATALSFKVLHSDISTSDESRGEFALDVDSVEDCNGEHVTIGSGIALTVQGGGGGGPVDGEDS